MLRKTNKKDYGKSINLDKAGGVIQAVCQWPPRTDYDVFALVLYKDGSSEVVSTFGTQCAPHSFSMSNRDGSVRHLGDVRRGSASMASETIEINMSSDVRAVVPVVYSAQSNGTGSFRQYQVSMSIRNSNGAEVVIDARNANKNDNIYSCVPGMIVNEGVSAEVRALELYSQPGSERRPVVDGSLNVRMDAGDVNAYK